MILTRYFIGVCIAALAVLPQAAIGQSDECVRGMAFVFPCKDVDLLAHIDIDKMYAPGSSSGHHLNDVWGWTDPLTGKEYALVGRSDALQFVDVSDPTDPQILGILPSRDDNRSTWRDVKVYKNFAFVVMDAASTVHGMQVFDLAQLRNVSGSQNTFEPTVWYDKLHSAHNIVINEESGFAYAVGGRGEPNHCNGAYHIIDIRNPLEPTFAGCHLFVSVGLCSRRAVCKLSWPGPRLCRQGNLCGLQ